MIRDERICKFFYIKVIFVKERTLQQLNFFIRSKDRLESKGILQIWKFVKKLFWYFH